MAKKKKGRRNIVLEFDNYFGTGTLDDWQRLCTDIGIDGYLSSISKCRKVGPTNPTTSKHPEKTGRG